MPTRLDQFPSLAAKNATSPEVAALFNALIARAEACAKLQDEQLEAVTRHREARTGKPFRHTKRQQKMLHEFDTDAEKALQDERRLVSGMDDAALLASALAGEQFKLHLDEDMFTSYREEDRGLAARIIDFRKETIRRLEAFLEISPLKEKVLRILPRKKWTNAS